MNLYEKTLVMFQWLKWNSRYDKSIKLTSCLSILENGIRKIYLKSNNLIEKKRRGDCHETRMRTIMVIANVLKWEREKINSESYVRRILTKEFEWEIILTTNGSCLLKDKLKETIENNTKENNQKKE